MFAIAHEDEPTMALTPDAQYHSGHASRAGAPRSAVETTLTRCFDDAFASPSSEASASLQAAALAFGREVRAVGLRPEQLVLQLKDLLFGHADLAGKPSLNTEGDARTPRARPMYGDVLHWTLDAYFADAAVSPVSR